jgi:hypothetical protein
MEIGRSPGTQDTEDGAAPPNEDTGTQNRRTYRHTEQTDQIDNQPRPRLLRLLRLTPRLAPAPTPTQPWDIQPGHHLHMAS